jgi:ribulose-phosphate 3-epimerase
VEPVRVVPALLATSAQDYREKLTRSSFAPFLQIDYMDGRFVPSASVGLDEAASIPVPVPYEAHLMVDDPLPWIEALPRPNLRRVIVHAEAGTDLAAAAAAVTGIGCQPALGINPGTGAAQVLPWLGLFPAVLVMTVNPGFYGSPFLPEVLGKIGDLRRSAPGLVIGVDGGVALDNLERILGAGADYVCVGSRIFAAPDPPATHRQFSAAALAAATPPGGRGIMI